MLSSIWSRIWKTAISALKWSFHIAQDMIEFKTCSYIFWLMNSFMFEDYSLSPLWHIQNYKQFKYWKLAPEHIYFLIWEICYINLAKI